jgi:hypothetical protein
MNGNWRSSLRATALSAILGFAPTGLAQTTQPTDSISSLAEKNAELQKKTDAMQAQMDSLQKQVNTPPQHEGTVQKVLLDNQPITFPGDVTAGYLDGFYLQQGDDFKIKVNGLFDVRYTFAQAENKTSLTNTALGHDRYGDQSGFSLNTGQLAISGYIFHNILFKVMGNFGSQASFAAPSAGTFQLNELWLAYSFSPKMIVRAGSMILPFVPLRALANNGGSEFPDFADSILPYVPGYGLGADVYGALDDNKFWYDFMIGNGSNSQFDVDSAVNGGGLDNRLSFYDREQFAGAGTLADFAEEPDLQNHDKLVWIAGYGIAWETQNSNANAFPSPQTGTQIGGLSTAGEGFIPARYVLDGSLFRTVVDFRTKYHGWSTYAEAAYQNIQSEDGPIIAGSPKTSVGQIGYFIQSGYFLIPKKFEAAGRFGQLYTNGLPHQMDVYTLGLNYYLFGENTKLQLAETYIPRQAALTSSNGSLVNTQDWITELQLQMKF